MLCMTWPDASSRLSKGLALTVDLGAGLPVFESLKRRHDGIYRSMLLPPALLGALKMVYGVCERQGQRGQGRGVRL